MSLPHRGPRHKKSVRFDLPPPKETMPSTDLSEKAVVRKGDFGGVSPLEKLGRNGEGGGQQQQQRRYLCGGYSREVVELLRGMVLGGGER